MKWFKETFRTSVLLLLSLAEAETEKWANNATGILNGAFQLYLGGTEVPILERLSIIEDVLISGSPSRKQVALRALGALFDINPIRSSESEEFGSKPVPREWIPATRQEARDAYLRGLELVRRAVRDSDSSVSRFAEHLMVSSARSIVALGLADQLIPDLERLTPSNDEEKRKIHEEIGTILDYEQLTADQRER